jgi:hypothetical protein
MVRYQHCSPRLIVDYLNGMTRTGRTLTFPDSTTLESRALAWLIDVDETTSVAETLALRQRSRWLRCCCRGPYHRHRSTPTPRMQK